jgi:regulator of replication initiation timing
MTSDESEHMMAFSEKEKQIHQLHRNINALKTNLNASNLLAELKAKNQLTDNENLLKEVNDMRQEIRHISIENHMLRADLHEATRFKGMRKSIVPATPVRVPVPVISYPGVKDNWVKESLSLGNSGAGDSLGYSEEMDDTDLGDFKHSQQQQELHFQVARERERVRSLSHVNHPNSNPNF